MCCWTPWLLWRMRSKWKCKDTWWWSWGGGAGRGEEVEVVVEEEDAEKERENKGGGEGERRKEKDEDEKEKEEEEEEMAGRRRRRTRALFQYKWCLSIYRYSHHRDCLIFMMWISTLVRWCLYWNRDKAITQIWDIALVIIWPCVLSHNMLSPWCKHLHSTSQVNTCMSSSYFILCIYTLHVCGTTHH